MTAERLSGDLGRKLREARERKGVSLRQIANSTKIAVSVLDGLERNDISKLPGGIFGRAFVRSFATEVGLDPEATIQEFIAQYRDESVAVGHPASEQIEDNEALESNRRMASTFLGLIAISIPVAAAITYFGFAERREAVAIERHVPTPSAPDASAALAAQASPLAAAANGGNEGIVPATPAPDTVPSTSAPTTSAPPAAAASNPAGERFVVAISASRPCWVSATVDGQKQLERLLAAGDERTFDVPGELVLSVGDAGALSVTINGAAARPLGRAGEVLTVRLNGANL